jgi:hypothetical protein
MFIDSQTIFSWGQNIFASGADVNSTNIYDCAPHLTANAAFVPDEFTGKEFCVEILILTAVTGGTSIQPVLQTDTNINFATALVEFPMSAAIPVASAIAGKRVSYQIPNSGCKRYLRVAWRNVGANAAGTGSAWMGIDTQMSTIQSAGGYVVG